MSDNGRWGRRSGIAIRFQNWRADAYAGLMSAIIYFPPSMAWGMIAFAPLGIEYVGIGILAGVYSSIFSGIITAAYGGMPLVQSGSRSASALLFATLLVSVTNSLSLNLSDSTDISFLLAIAFFTVSLSGVIQVVFGRLRLGRLIKYIPHSISIGFINATSLLILTGQIWPLLSLPKGNSFLELTTQLEQASFGGFFFGILTLVFIWHFPKLSKKIPAPIAGLVVATILYQAWSMLGGPDVLGKTLGVVILGFPTPDKLLLVFTQDGLSLVFNVLPIVLLAAFSMALMSSIDTLMTASAAESMTTEQADGDRMLVGQGIANILIANIGAIGAAATPSRTIPAIKIGAKTALVSIYSSIVMLIILVFISPYLQYMPQAAFAGFMVFVAIQLFDRWSVKQFANIHRRTFFDKPELAKNIILIITVVVVSQVYDLIAAVMVGLILAIGIFVIEMSRSPIRNIRFGDNFHSRTFRNAQERNILEEKGRTIAVIELEGPVFFGSAESIRKSAEDLKKGGVRHLILDMAKVTYVDFTGVKIISRLYDALNANDDAFYITNIQKERRKQRGAKYDGEERRQRQQERRVWRCFEEARIFKNLDSDVLTLDVDRALERSENCILSNLMPAKNHVQSVFSPDTEFFAGLTNDEITVVRPSFEKCIFARGAYIMREGDEGDFLVLIERGLVDVTISVQSAGNQRRMGSLSEGTIVGEMALLDGKNRSANVLVSEEVTCYKLSTDNFEEIKKDYPEIAYKLLTNLSLLFASRLRTVTRMVSES